MPQRIDWRTIDENTFNDVVEALLVNSNTTDGLVAHAPDGRGGDDGIDIAVRSKKTDQIIHIYQLKYFPGGMSGGFVGRRQQVKASLIKAIRMHSPGAWTLVLPMKVTLAERKAILAMKPVGRTAIRFMGPPELDALLAQHPEIARRFTQDHARDLLREVHREEATLSRPNDLGVELRRIQSQLDNRSSYWGSSFSSQPDGTIIEHLYAKRPDAAQREPLRIDVSLAFSPELETLRKTFTDAMNFGVVRQVELPPEVVKTFKASGPEWWSREETGGELHILPAGEQGPEPITLVSRGPDGRRLGSISGTSTKDRGEIGIAIASSFPGGLGQIWRLPEDPKAGGEVDFNFSPAGSSASEVMQSLRFLATLPSANSVQISVSGHTLPLVALSIGKDFYTAPEGYKTVLEDLTYIEKTLDMRFTIPDGDIAVVDAVWARVVSRILQGYATPFPGVDGLNFTFAGNLDPDLGPLVEHGGVFLASVPGWSCRILGTDVYVEDVFIFCRMAKALNGAVLRQMLREGSAEGKRVEVRAMDGLPFVIYAPGASREGQVETRGWELGDLPEHPGLARHEELGTKTPRISKRKRT
jgi:hypothetical protein